MVTFDTNRWRRTCSASQVDGGIVMVHVHAHEKEGTRNTTKPSGCKHSRDVEGSTHAVLLPPKSLCRNSWPAVDGLTRQEKNPLLEGGGGEAQLLY